MNKTELLKRRRELVSELEEIELKLQEFKKPAQKEIKLDRIYKSSELINAIHDRYKNTGMTVRVLRRNGYGGLHLEFGPWRWSGKKEFIGKQYFKTQKFTYGDCDGYRDPERFISEITGMENFGTGGIASYWYRHNIKIPEKFEFDVEL